MKTLAKHTGQRIAIVAHGELFNRFFRPFPQWPKLYGSPRGWPLNFKPYFARVAQGSTSGRTENFLLPDNEGAIMIVRHAMSENNQKLRDKRKEKKSIINKKKKK